ncbi:hypothetical protein H0H93_004785 [Arthromyces matolae]|nr:hypothetical protein H0H93_004785 [Arthromyces matolae]
MRPYPGTYVSFAFLLIVSNHVNSLPTRRSSNANELGTGHAEIVLADIQEITTPNIEVDSGIAVRNMDGTPPASQDVRAHSTTALGTDNQGRTGTKRKKFQHPPLAHCPNLLEPDNAPSSYPGMSSGASNSENASDAFRGTESTLDPKKAIELITEMLTMHLDKRSLPWKINGVWTDGMMKAVLQALINKKWNFGRRTNTALKQEARKERKPTPPLVDLSRPSAAEVQGMDRATLIAKLDELWDEAVERRWGALTESKKKARENGKMVLSHIKTGATELTNNEITTLLKNIPRPDKLDNMSGMPWNDLNSTCWDPSWMKPILRRIWERQRDRYYGLAQDAQVQAKRRNILEGPEDEEMRKELDEGWKWWLEQNVHRTEISQQSKKKKLTDSNFQVT